MRCWTLSAYACLISVTSCWAQSFDASQVISNQPASVPTTAWPDSREANLPPGNGSQPVNLHPEFGSSYTAGALGTGRSTQTTPTINPFERSVQTTTANSNGYSESPTNRASTALKTPIRRNPDSTFDANATQQTEPPPAAEMLRTGAWTSGLAVVILALIGVTIVTFLKRRHPELSGGLPREVCDVLGRKRIDPRTSVCLVRLNNRILVLGVTADSVAQLSEIDDPVEVDQLAGLCRVSEGNTLPSFRGLLRKRVAADAPESTRATAGPNRSTKGNAADDRHAANRGQELADLPGLRGLKPGQSLDFTTP